MNEHQNKLLRAPRRSARRVEDLVDEALLDPQHAPEIERVLERFALAVTPAMQDLIVRGDGADPIARQFVPTAAELTTLPEERTDPIGDDAHAAVKGIIHRYPDRVLLKPVHVCPVYCRFCFRREKVGPGGEALSAAELQAAFGYIRRHARIWEVILTGGDPLIMAERRIADIIRSLDAIPHVEVIRIHTRVPVVDPDRITPGIVAALKVETPVYVVLHCNHARELTAQARAACARLVNAGIPMLNQSVLLKGVNDDPASMEQLLRALVAARVKPYYLHHGDLAEGTSHFRTSITEGRQLMRQLRGRVSGICQPTYVLDIPGGFGKVPIGPNYLEGSDAGDRYQVTDYQDGTHLYPPAGAAPAAMADAVPAAANAPHRKVNPDIGDADLQPLMSEIAAAMVRLQVPGAAVGLIHEGREYATGVGVTNVEHALPVDGDTFFQIGSITKTMTATAAMRLAERGGLGLDVPVRSYLPDLRLADEDVARRVTLRHIFTHTGGWLGDLLADTGPGDDALARMVDRLVEMPPLTPLGEVWSCSNSGLYLAGRVIEVVTGATFESAVKELVLAPLGMERTTFFGADVITHRFAVGHDLAGDDKPFVRRPWVLPRSANVLGGLHSTARDLLRYAKFHLGDGTAPSGERLLTPESIATMQSPPVPARGDKANGLPWWVNNIGGAKVVWHEGSTHGQRSILVLVPERGFALAILTNADRGATLLCQIKRWALRHYLGLSNPQLAHVELPPPQLAEYAGRYVSAEAAIVLEPRDGGLRAHVPERRLPDAVVAAADHLCVLCGRSGGCR